jgi:hypothetical protein
MTWAEAETHTATALFLKSGKARLIKAAGKPEDLPIVSDLLAARVQAGARYI